MSTLFFCDPRRFLHSLEKRKCLYDITHPDYKDREVTERMWHELAKEFDLPDVRVAKMRWRNMKDSYMKYRKSCLPGAGPSNYRNWRWARHVRFLDPFIYRAGRTFLLKRNAPRVGGEGDADGEGDGEGGGEGDDRQSSRLRKYLLKERYSASASEGDGSATDKERRHETDFSEDDPLGHRVDVEVKAEPAPGEPAGSASANASPAGAARADEVEHLFLSYAETFRRLSARRQVLVKGQLASLFLRAELELLQEQGLAAGGELLLLQTCFGHDLDHQ